MLRKETSNAGSFLNVMSQSFYFLIFVLSQRLREARYKIKHGNSSSTRIETESQLGTFEATVRAIMSLIH
jgi:hypothetical protein